MFSGSVRKAVVFLLLIHYGALADDKPCTVRDKGKYYDLNPLKASKDYEVNTSTNQSMWLNVCQNVKTDLFGIKDDNINAGDVGGFIHRAHGDFIMGKMNSVVTVFDSRPRFVMSQGSRCKAGEETTAIRASSLVEFICDASVYGAGSPRLLAQLPPGEDESGCAYVIEWRTQYACPTSESGGVWGFFAIMAVVFLVLLMTYTVLGTLYNRFVLQLRGFDQIPQFSIESMKYHGREAWDWIKDMTTALDIGGSRRRGQGQHYSDISSGGGFNFRRDEEFETGHESNNDGSQGTSNFVRPQLDGNRSTAFQRANMNPVSHQSQVHAEQSLSFSSSKSPSPPASIQSPPQPEPNRDHSLRLTVGSTQGSAQKSKDFMLGDDDEDAQELGEVHVAPPLRSASSSSQNASDDRSVVPTTSSETSSAAVVRGRDMGGGNVTLL